MEKYIETAEWHAKLYADKSTIGATVKGVPFRCCEIELKSHTQNAPSDGMLADGVGLALASVCASLNNAKADDTVSYKGANYSVDRIIKRRSTLFYNAVEFILYLK